MWRNTIWDAPLIKNEFQFRTTENSEEKNYTTTVIPVFGQDSEIFSCWECSAYPILGQKTAFIAQVWDQPIEIFP